MGFNAREGSTPSLSTSRSQMRRVILLLSGKKEILVRLQVGVVVYSECTVYTLTSDDSLFLRLLQQLKTNLYTPCS